MYGHSTLLTGTRFALNFRLTSWALLTLVFGLTLFQQPAKAQAVFGSLVGNVTDATGGVIAGAAVKVTLTQTNEVRNAITGSVGEYDITTLTPGTYNVEVTKAGFRAFSAGNVIVNQNNVVRVDVQLSVGAASEKIEVMAEAASALETDRADVHSELSNTDLQQLPQPNRTYSGLLEMVPGAVPPGGQLAGGTNNPSKSMQFAFNGSGTVAPTVRIEGMNSVNLWVRQYQSYVPSVEAIQDVNIATNANDAEQGIAGGASVNVILKSGSNQTHGAAYLYNMDSAFEANNFFSNASGVNKPPHLVDNNTGAYIGGHVIRNKLFYFGSYEGDYARYANSGVLSLPPQVELGGDFSSSPNPIYDPSTGAANGTGKTPFSGNIIPKSRINPVSLKIIPNIPLTNVGGPAQIANNFFINDANVYNLHKVDTKYDYVANGKLRLSGRWGKQPYYNFQQPIYGETLGGSSAFANAGAGNYLQHGAGTAYSGSGSYIFNPTFIVDASFGRTNSHQLLFPNLTNTRYGLDTLGIPGTNNGPLPWTGGVPNFDFNGNFVRMGASYPALEYNQPMYEYVVNATKTKGTHTIRFGTDLSFQHPKHIEDRNNIFYFTGAATILNGGPGANQYNALADFVLGNFYEGTNWLQVLQPYLTMRQWEFAAYVRDQWHVSPKLTVNYGVRWEYYPVPTRDPENNKPSSVSSAGLGSTGNGLYFLDMQHATVSVCGAGGIPTDCGISISKRLFAPSIGIAYRPVEKLVIRAGYSLSPFQEAMGTVQMQAFPGEVQLDEVAPNTYSYVGNLTTGLPQILAAPGNNSVYPLLPATGNVTAVNSQKQFTRGYFQSYNFTVQRQLPFDMFGSIGYVGTHAVKLQISVPLNYGQLGGGAASQPLAFLPDYSTGITSPLPYGADKYNSLQATLNKRFSKGLTFQMAYTYAKDIGITISTSTVLLPQYYQNRDYYTTALDRTHHLVLGGTYELPFGAGKPMASHGVAAAVLGGWSLNGIFNHYSGIPFTVTASGASCNCPGNAQTANIINASAARTYGSGINGVSYINAAAYAPVTGPVLGTGGFDQLRGPGNNNLDLSIFRAFKITERLSTQIRAESFNMSNTPHFNNPSNVNISNVAFNPDGSIRNLNGFGSITTTNPLGRLLDQRNFRFGFRLLF
jgi:hypothetical protein